MAAIDETEVIQTDSTIFLTADDLQGITGQLDQILTNQLSIDSKFDLYTSDALDRLTNLDNNIKEIRDYLLETEQQEDAVPVAESESIDYTAAIDQVNNHLLQVNENLTQVSQQLDDLTVYHYNMQNIAIPLLCAVSIAAGLLMALIFTHYLKH